MALSNRQGALKDDFGDDVVVAREISSDPTGRFKPNGNPLGVHVFPSQDTSLSQLCGPEKKEKKSILF